MGRNRSRVRRIDPSLPRSSAAPSWTPASLPSLGGWWRGDLGITLDGSSNVQQWNDQSGNGFNFLQSTSAYRPPYAASGLGGQAAIDTHAIGSVRFMATAQNANAIMTSSSTLYRFMVFTPLATQTFSGFFSTTMGNSGEGSYLPYTDGNFYDDFGGSSRIELTGLSGYLGAPVLYEVIAQSGGFTAYINGTQIGITFGTVVGAASSPLVILGSTGSACMMYLAEIGICNAIPSSTVRAQLASYATERYGFLS